MGGVWLRRDQQDSDLAFVSFTSFAVPPSVFRDDFAKNSLRNARRETMGVGDRWTAKVRKSRKSGRLPAPFSRP